MSCVVYPAEGSTDGDILLHCKDGKNVCVHALLLQLASPVLRDCLDCNRDADGSINMPDETSEEWVPVLRFLYPTEPNPDVCWENVEALLKVSHKYNIKLVLDACIKFLTSNTCTVEDVGTTVVRPSNMFKWLSLSEAYGLDEIYNKFMKEVQERCSNCANKTRSWSREDERFLSSLRSPSNIRQLGLKASQELAIVAFECFYRVQGKRVNCTYQFPGCLTVISPGDNASCHSCTRRLAPKCASCNGQLASERVQGKCISCELMEDMTAKRQRLS